MVIFVLLMLVMAIILLQTYNRNTIDIENDSQVDENGNQIEGFWYYPNCMETVFGGMRCYPYHYYPYRRYYNPMFPWTYYY